MGIEINEGTIKISTSYSLKVPGPVDFSSEDAYYGYSLEYDVQGDSTAALASAEGVAAQLEKAAKLAVFAQLGVGFTEDENGIIFPKLTPAAPVAPSAPPSQPSNPSGGNFKGRSEGGSNQQWSPPKASKEDIDNLPLVYVDFAGKGTAQYRDQRPLKAAGKYKATAPDFKNTQDGQDSVWLVGKSGDVNADVAAALVAAGVDATPFDR